MLFRSIPENTYPLRKDFKWDSKLSRANVPYPMHAVEGKGIYEIPVGPIHAGIIEPGHFRFTANGEVVVRLEERLGFVHKGVNRLMTGASIADASRFNCSSAAGLKATSTKRP